MNCMGAISGQWASFKESIAVREMIIKFALNGGIYA